MLAFASWFPLVAAADALMVGAGAWRFADALGLARLVGVIAQAIVASLEYLSPFLVGAPRAALVQRLGTTAGSRAALWNAGVVAIALASVLRSSFGAALARAGWAAILVAIATIAVTIASVAFGARDAEAPSST